LVYNAYVYALRYYYRSQCKTYAGKTILITGASSGVGLEMAKQYASKNANLVLAARRLELLENVKNECEKLGAKEVLCVKADVGVKKDCKELIEKAIEKFNLIDILVLNAGKSTLEFFEKIDDTDLFRDFMNVNYFQCVDLTHYALPYLKKSKDPKIVAVSSVTGLTGVPRRTLYSPTKHAMQGFFDSLRFEIGDSVQITVVSPGYILTEIHNDFMEKNKVKRDTSKFLTADKAASLIIRAEQERVNNLVIPWARAVMFFFIPFSPYYFIKLVMKKEAVPFDSKE